MNCNINYREALGHVIDLSCSTVACESLDFMTQQQTRAVDANINDRIRFVTIACNLNEFLYKHHPLITGVPVHARWLFHIGNAYCRCFLYALIFWTNQVIAIVANEVALAIGGGGSKVMSLDEKVRDEVLTKIATVRGLARYCTQFAAPRSSYARQRMRNELNEMEERCARLDLVYGWLCAGKLYRTYLTTISSHTETVITAAVRYAESCYKRIKDEASGSSSTMLKEIQADCDMLRDVTKGEWHYRKGNKVNAVVLWRRAVKRKKYEATTEQVQARDDVEADGLSIELSDSDLDALEPHLETMRTFCAKGHDPLKVDCGFQFNQKKKDQ